MTQANREPRVIRPTRGGLALQDRPIPPPRWGVIRLVYRGKKRVKRRKRRPLVGSAALPTEARSCDTVKLREVPKAVATKPVSKEDRWPG